MKVGFVRGLTLLRVLESVVVGWAHSLVEHGSEQGLGAGGVGAEHGRGDACAGEGDHVDGQSEVTVNKGKTVKSSH